MRQPEFPFSPAQSAVSLKYSGKSGGTSLAMCASMAKYFVYVLKNKETPPRYYTGITSAVARRTVEHNAGSCVHTAKYRPWCVDLVIEFPTAGRAAAFERYLKSGSGVAFAQRHLR
jgi:putative endonuclease